MLNTEHGTFSIYFNHYETYFQEKKFEHRLDLDKYSSCFKISILLIFIAFLMHEKIPKIKIKFKPLSGENF